MANEIFNNVGGVSDLRLAESMAVDIQRLIADTASLWNLPPFRLVGDITGTNSNVIAQPQAGLGGYDIMAAVAENASSSNTALTDSSPSITVSRQSLQREVSDMYLMTGGRGSIDLDMLAVDMVLAAAMRGTELICSVGDDFTSTVGTTTVAMSVDDFLDAQFTLTQAKVSAAICVLYPKQFTDLQNSLMGVSGPLQFVPAVQNLLDQAGQGLQGTLNGVPIWLSSHVPTANGGSDSAGFMCAAGAIGKAVGTPPAVRGAEQQRPDQFVSVEFSRNGSGALTEVIGNAFMGASILLDGAGVAIITDR